MARPREKLKIPDRSSRIVEIGDIEKKLANYGRAFLNDLGKNAFESDAELSKFIGCSSRDCKTMREYFLNEVQFTYLTDLKDSLLCQSDYICLDDHSENPGRTDSRITKDVHKSGFFFINNVFYNDMRDPSNIEYSKEIFDWISKQDKKDVEPFRYYTTSRMEGIRFSDLKLRLGYPYIYMHQFNCEHIISFEDLRYNANYSAVYKGATYKPESAIRVSRTWRKLIKKCVIFAQCIQQGWCIYHRWMTRKDMLAFTDPSYFCDRCFDYLHYDENHKKVAEFKAYPFRKC
ncbi:snRNA-activating protein complex subunit 3 [Thelohanellus kitauei]|uniref:snRNA-activating protein complex subunit 3 n=1 Tax=Thelohanellus kitauei TaxID=669202 RepID=A0A0C2MWP5_THEKT|nr:snRNA-activating protein complex subunit 3 [Thelohanellus kitauei]